MKRYKLILLLPFVPFAFVCAQEPLVPVPGKACYFDISPPLKNQRMQHSGKTDCSWKECVVPNYISTGGLNNNFRAWTCDTVIQLQNGYIFPDALIRNFDGLGNVNNVVPPDTHGDVGPSHYFHLVNYSFAIYDKTGVKLVGPTNTSQIWDGLPHNSNNGDGIVLYDEQADRWLISQFSFPSFPFGPFYQMIAVSQTSDPTGSWYRWEFAFGDLPDYPKFGIWYDGYYMSYTRLKSQTLQRDGVGAVAFDRNAMINGNPQPLNIRFIVPSAECPVSLLPSDCDGPFPPTGTPNYYGYIRNGQFVIREFQTNWANPSVSTFGNVLQLPVSPFSGISQGGIPQKESDKLLSALDDRLMYRLQYRKFNNHQTMVVNHTVGVDSIAAIRWYELRKTNANWFINQQSTYAPDSLSRWMGSIAMDSAGNIALGYSVCGASMFPSIRFTGRMKNDPNGQMTVHETKIIDGSGSQTGIWSGQSRWGDYSSMTIDPSAPSTFWYAQEYYSTTSNNGWKTRIASFSFAGILDLRATSYPPAVCLGGSLSLDVEVSGGSGTYNYLWTSEPAGFMSGLKNPTVTPATPATYIVQVTSGSQVKTASVFIPVIPAPSAFAGNDTIICRYLAEIPLTGTVSNNYSVMWFASGDGYFTQPDALNTLYHMGLNDKLSDSLIFKLTAYPATPCLPVSATRTISLDDCTGVTELSENSFRVNLHPNPADKKITIDISGMKDQMMTIVISNLLDEAIYSETNEVISPIIERQIDVSGYSKGVYFLRVQTKSGIIIRPFMVK